MFRAGERRLLSKVAVTLGIVALAVAFAWWDDDAGLRAWWRLRADLAAANARIAAVEERIAARSEEARALKSDPLAQERAIRHDLQLAREGETIVYLRESGAREPKH